MRKKENIDLDRLATFVENNLEDMPRHGATAMQLRMHPDFVQAVKVVAKFDDVSLNSMLGKLVCEYLHGRGVIDRPDKTGQIGDGFKEVIDNINDPAE